MFFKKNKYSMPTEKIRALDRRGIKYATERDSDTYAETRAGENGAVNIENNEFMLVCGGKNIIRCDIGKVNISELMNLSGIVIKGLDKDTGREKSVIAYFSDGTVRVKTR